MNTQVIKIPRVSDSILIKNFRDLGAEHDATFVNVTASGFARLGRIELNDMDHEELNSLLAHDSTLIDSILINFRGLVIHYYRGGSSSHEKRSLKLDEIVMSLDTQTATVTNIERVNIVADLTQKFNAFDPNNAKSTEHSSFDHLEQLHEKILNDHKEALDAIKDKEIALERARLSGHPVVWGFFFLLGVITSIIALSI